MKAKIAVATVSGKAYYKLVNELKGRGLPFLSLLPTNPIPLDIKVVVTTERERCLISHHNVLVFEDEADPAPVVDKAIRMSQGKQSYDTIVIGVDPGKTFGLAVVGDGAVLETITCPSLEDAVNTIKKILSRSPAIATTVKIGNGTPNYTSELLHKLGEKLPRDIVIEVVNEAGTSRFKREGIHRREARDAMSAVKIAERKG